VETLVLVSQTADGEYGFRELGLKVLDSVRRTHHGSIV
jgi:hypothetical protein